MKKTIVLFLFIPLWLGVQMQGQDTKAENLYQLIDKSDIPKYEYKKFWEILAKNYIAYNPNEKWIVVSDSSAYICEDEKCPIRNMLAMQSGILSHHDEECMIAIRVAFDPIEKVHIPYTAEEAREYIFTRVSNSFEWSKKYLSRTKQDLIDVEMLVTDYPEDIAKSIFNGSSMFIYPLNFKGEYCQDKYRYGRGVVVLAKYNIPLFLYFFMTEKSITSFDKYLSELKGVFWFEEVENM